MGRREFLEIVTGGVVLAAAAAFVVYLNIGGGGGESGGSYGLTASFSRIDGISAGDDVRLVGVRVGSVEGIDIDYDRYRASVRLSIAGGVRIPDDSVAEIRSDGLLGGGYVSILPGASETNLAAGDAFGFTRGAVDFIDLLGKAVGGGS